jgi:uncharacterized membrane protein (DUF485 family)
MTVAPNKPEIYDEIHASADFQDLRRRYHRFAIPWTIAFFAWYTLYVLCSNWAPDFMGHKLAGNINVGLVFGLLQFISTFVIAWLYARHASKELDPIATKLETHYEREISR